MTTDISIAVNMLHSPAKLTKPPVAGEHGLSARQASPADLFQTGDRITVSPNNVDDSNKRSRSNTPSYLSSAVAGRSRNITPIDAPKPSAARKGGLPPLPPSRPPLARLPTARVLFGPPPTQNDTDGFFKQMDNQVAQLLQARKKLRVDTPSPPREASSFE